jgi:ribosomal protein S18 acetylase RimI-like enzyme
MQELEIEYSAPPKETDVQKLTIGLSQEAKKSKNLLPMKPFSLMLCDENKLTHGGLSGLIYFGCLYIDQIWISTKYRHQGLGSKLIKHAEEIAISNKCRFATLCTMDWEAQDLYQKLGYSIEFIREGYDNDSKMIFLRKELQH